MSISMSQNPFNTTFRFKNGYALSIIIGPGTYSSDHMETETIINRFKTPGMQSNNAEIAIWGPDGNFHRVEGQDDDVIGWVSVDQIAEVAYWVSMGDMDAVRDAINRPPILKSTRISV